ncbi:hypothetical protein ACKKBG_A10715 [Auxenochlorella protothecoides x Auxenochlorella symbiontica]
MDRPSRFVRPRPGGQGNVRVWQRRSCKVLLYTSWLLLLVWALASAPTSKYSGAGHTPTKVDYDTLRPAQHVTESSLGSGSIPPAVQAGTPPRQPERIRNIQPPPAPVASDGVATNQIPQTGAQQQAVDAGRQASSSGAQQEASQARQIAGKVQPASEALPQIHAGAVGAQQAASGSPAGKPAPGVVSEATVQVVPDSKGQMVKHYYRFSNVQLTRKELRFFYPEGFQPPAERWVDYISGNSTTPDLPTKLVIKGEVTGILTYYMNVSYVPAAEEQPVCKGWIEKPAYLLQVRYASNIWHSWNEGLAGIFQTLRELGYLPLVQIDAEGYMREVVEGMGGAECAAEYDPVTKTVRPGKTCTKKGLVKERRCDPKNQAWCTPGVVSYRRFDGAPLIVYYTDASVHNRWRHMYYSMTEDIRSLDDMEGYCYRTLIVGKTSTLNFYQYNTANITSDHITQRKSAMAVFKAYIMTAQQQAMAEQRARDPASTQFWGYAPPAMELLRRGIGPENIGLADAIGELEVPHQGVRENMGTLSPGWQAAAAAADAAMGVEVGVQAEASGAGAAATVGAGAGSAVAAPVDPGTTAAATGAGAAGAASVDPVTSAAATGTGTAAATAADPDSAATGTSATIAAAAGDPVRTAGGAETLAASTPTLPGTAATGTQPGATGAAAVAGVAVGTGTAATATGSDPGTSSASGGGLAASGSQGVEAAGAQAGQASAADTAAAAGDAVAQQGAALVDAGAQGAATAGGASAGQTAQQRRRSGRRIMAAAAGQVAGLEASAEDAATAAAAETAEAMREAARVEAALAAMPRLDVPTDAQHRHEPFRPVVTYMCRPFFSRGVLNEVDILRYILRNYNVTLRVTTFQEPLLEVLDLMGHTDVLVGMHGAGWTNAMFIKHGASAMQMYPYGWRLSNGAMIRGANYREIVLASDCPYHEWVNHRPGYAFFRKIDFHQRLGMEPFEHPGPEVPRPKDGLPGSPWVYQNTYVDLETFGREFDAVMAGARIPKMGSAAGGAPTTPVA